MLKIAVVGPESSGKTTLCEALMVQRQAWMVSEVAREFLGELERPYVEADLLAIAKAQAENEDMVTEEFNGVMVCDTDLITMRIWSEEKYGRCDPWILRQSEERHSFSEDFYEKVTYSKLQPVMDTLRWLKAETSVWLEITNLVIPDLNDSTDELRRMSDWILDAVGPEVPLHFSAFHPDFRMMDRPRTPHETLIRARTVARQQGLKYVYVGNVSDVMNQSTWCPGCGEMIIQRDGYQIGLYRLTGHACQSCGTLIAGHFDRAPGQWGSRRLPVRIRDFAT